MNDADAQFRLWQARLARIDEDMAQARARRPPGAGSARDPATIDLLSRIERDRAALARAIDGLRGGLTASSGARRPTAGHLERLGLQIERALGAVLERP
ncbi:MAG: hypothetical protein ACO305_10990 [Rubrivivax sp.]